VITQNSIDVRASAADVYSLAENVAEWPRLLPHYRYVKVLSETADERVAVMAARRDWIPVRWTAAQHLLPAIPRIEFTHIAGWTAGMRVAWIFDPIPHGTRVTIWHDLDSLRLPLVRTRLGREIVAKLFVAPIASKTLARIKVLAEAGRG
jgi:ribosome-associated toxin RatA of RatAB toxin-antitoxin module